MQRIEDVPAIVRQVDELKALASRINAEHEAGEESTRRSLEHYRAAGQMLLRAKRQCGHGQWLSWLKQNVSFSERRAQRYMELAKSDVTSDLEQQESLWRCISGNESLAGSLCHDSDEELASGLEQNASGARLPHVAHNSGENEWYTPPEFLEAARFVLGSIELDPASSDEAQKNVRAETYFTKEDDGLAQHWAGKVFLNPPYQAGLIDQFIAKLVGHLETGDVTEAIVLVNNATETSWFQSLARQASAICFPHKRIKYLDASGEPANSPLQGQAFLYLGMNRKEFLRFFSPFGLVVEVKEVHARTASDSFQRLLISE